MKIENSLISRVCHDLITPLNAINLGLDAYDMSGDASLLSCVKDSVVKANSILKFTRELFSDKSESFCYSIQSVQTSVQEYASLCNIEFEFNADIERIPTIAAKIIMYNFVVLRDVLPFGGQIKSYIDNSSNQIVSSAFGRGISGIVIPNKNDVNYKNIMLYNLSVLLNESGFSVAIKHSESCITITETIV